MRLHYSVLEDEDTNDLISIWMSFCIFFKILLLGSRHCFRLSSLPSNLVRADFAAFILSAVCCPPKCKFCLNSSVNF